MKWRVRVGDSAKGPFSFKQLVGLILRGKVGKESQVQADGESDWIYAESIPGLFRAAKLASSVTAAQEAEAADEPAALDESPKSSPQLSTWKRPASKRDVKFAAGGLLGLMALGLSIWFLTRPNPFPHEGAPELIFQSVPRLEQIVPAKPNEPTLAIATGRPVKVAGLGQQPWARCPSLSRDLLHVTFLATFESQNEIWISRRPDASASFEKPKPVSLEVSTAKDFPSISPDGLSLVFCTQSDEHNTVWISRRESVQDSFVSATELEQIEGLKTEGLHVDGCKWCDSNSIQIAVGDSGFTFRKQYLLSVDSETVKFKQDEQLPLANPWPRPALSTNRMRAYSFTESGLTICARSTLATQFVTPELLVESNRLGPVQQDNNYPFLVPNEDILFFFGPGPESDDFGESRLWMLRIR